MKNMRLDGDPLVGKEIETISGRWHGYDFTLNIIGSDM